MVPAVLPMLHAHMSRVCCMTQGGVAGSAGGGRTAPAGRGAGAPQVHSADGLCRHAKFAEHPSLLISSRGPLLGDPAHLHADLSHPMNHDAILTTDSCLLCSRNLGVRASLEAARSAASAAKSALDARCGGRISEAPGPCLDQRAS